MIININNQLVEITDEEAKIIKFFLENSFKTLSDLMSEKIVSIDFVFPGIFNFDKHIFNVLLSKLQALSINTCQINAQNIVQENNEYFFD